MRALPVLPLLVLGCGAPGPEPAPPPAPPAPAVDPGPEPAPTLSVPIDAGPDDAAAEASGGRVWALAGFTGTLECVPFLVTGGSAEAPEQVSARVGGVDLTLQVEAVDGGVLLHGYNLSAELGGGRGMGAAGHCMKAMSPHRQGPSAADGFFYADLAGCEADRNAGAGSSLSSCVETGVAGFIARIPGRNPVPAGDPLLAHMRAAGDVWIHDGTACRAWHLTPDPSDPARGTIARSWREPDGAEVSRSYDYEYTFLLVTLKGPNGSRTPKQGPGAVWGTSCTDDLSVVHRSAASEVGGQNWHYDRAGCKVEKQAGGAGATKLGGC